jgi:hypothetical protein
LAEFVTCAMPSTAWMAHVQCHPGFMITFES